MVRETLASHMKSTKSPNSSKNQENLRNPYNSHQLCRKTKSLHIMYEDEDMPFWHTAEIGAKMKATLVAG